MKIGDNILYWTGISAGSGLVFHGNDVVLVDGQTRRNQAALIMELMKLYGLNPTSTSYLINTHSDFDHIGGNAEFLERIPGIKIVAGSPAVDKIENPIAMMETPTFRTERVVENLRRSRVSIKVEKDMTLTSGDVTLQIVCTPGHTPGSICVYHEASRALFTGDTVLGSGRWGGPKGIPLVRMDLATMLTSLEKLARLNVEWLLPGHGNIVQDGNRRIRESIAGLQALPNRVLRVIDQQRTLAEISDTLLVYPNTVQAALTLLEKEGKVRQVEAEMSKSETTWIAT
jgi:glyoxylase-like metal-dependent hydrolase (beta-lactamase superfamily II)